MSYAAVREAIVDYFSAATITGIQKVYRDMPWFIEAAQWQIEVPVTEPAPGDVPRTWAAVAFVHIDQSAESRITVGAPGPSTTPADAIGYKEVRYVVSLGMQYQYLVPVVLPDGYEADAWVDGLDTIIDTVKSLIRADPLLGTNGSGVIFQAGQDDLDIRVESDFPISDPVGNRVYSFHRVAFNVTEIINA